MIFKSFLVHSRDRIILISMRLHENFANRFILIPIYISVDWLNSRDLCFYFLSNIDSAIRRSSSRPR